ncbi:MAG TPA: PRC-barrel domain-containing protein [Planctomycetaceae bacterium]
MRKISATVTACAALLASAATAQDAPRVRAGAPPADPAAEREAGFYRASEILGATVRGSDGQELGQIQDLLIEQRTQQIRYFILGEGEAIDAQGSLTVVPWRAARPQFEGDQRFVDVRIEQQRLREAPTFTWQEIQTGPGVWATEVDRFYGVRGRGPRPGAEVEIEEDGVEIEGRGRRPGVLPPRRGEVEIEQERDGDIEVEGRARPGARPRAGVNVRPNGEVEVRPEAGEVEGDAEVEGRVRPEGGQVEIETEGDE